MPLGADTAAARENLTRRALRQAAWCDQLGSPFSAYLLRAVADDLKTEGAAWSVLAGFETEDFLSALSLRLLGALHRLVLAGDLPELARHYPSFGGDGDAVAAWPGFRDAMAGRTGEVRAFVKRPCQTNEVGRSAALLGGFLEVATRTKLPLRLLEIGASAGLNLRWDKYRYEVATGGWGARDSPVRFIGFFEVPPPLDSQVLVVERRGCDLNPVDPTTDEGSLTLRSFTWPDQLDRFHRLEGAIAIAGRVPAAVERMGAADFLQRELATPRPDVATVVYHSVFMQYVDATERARILDAIEQAQVSYLRFEPGGGGAATDFEVRLDDRLLGTAQAHGSRVRWS